MEGVGREKNALESFRRGKGWLGKVIGDVLLDSGGEWVRWRLRA